MQWNEEKQGCQSDRLQSVGGGGLCTQTLYLDIEDSNATQSQTKSEQPNPKEQTGLERMDDSSSEALEIPFLSAFAANDNLCIKSKLITTKWVSYWVQQHSFCM